MNETPAAELDPGDIVMTSSLRTAAIVRDVDADEVRTRITLEVWLWPSDAVETIGNAAPRDYSDELPS